MTTTERPETPKEAAEAQRQIEDVARRANDVRRAVEQLGNVLLKLPDYPEHLDGEMCSLMDAASLVAELSLDWAQISNTDFDPAKTTVTTEIPEEVLAAIKAVVAYNYYSTSGDDTDLLVNDLPVICAWLAGLGLLPPPPEETGAS
jgi:hypothetical protein